MQIDPAVNIKYLQMQMGHSSVNTSFDIYDHLMKTETPEAGTELRAAILGSDHLENKEIQATFWQQWERGCGPIGDNPLLLLEAASGVEPLNNGFADHCLSHLATPPERLLLRPLFIP